MLLKALKTKKIKNKKITSVAAVVFNDSVEILTVKLKKRGWDIPGGHVEKADKTLFNTVKREVLEECFVEIDDCKISTIIRSYYYQEPTYMLIVTANVKRILKFEKNNESSNRKFMNPASFLEKYNQINNIELMNKVIKNALRDYI